jgi:HlyD family secretion protein
MRTPSALPTVFTAGRKRNPLTASPRRLWLGAAALALPPALLLASCASDEPEPMTVRVARASVSSSVTATGALQVIKEQRLGFPSGGRLVEVNVAVGQPVEQGQILARVDDFAARKELEAAQAQLAEQQAVLARVRDGNQVSAADDDAERAKEVLEATEEQADAVDRANAEAVERAERRLSEDEEILEAAEDRAGCGEDEDDDRSGQDDEDVDDGDYGDGGDERRGFRFPVSRESCENNGNVQAAERRVDASREAVGAAEQKRQVDQAGNQLAIEKAKRDLTATQNEAEAARATRPHDIDEQSAVLSQLQSEVDTANREVENTVLRAPVAGTIESINGTVGEFVGGGTGTTALAPGGVVPLPDTGTGVSSSEDFGGNGETPGGSTFMVLGDINTFQMVAPFAETDAARLQVNQPVEVTFDAVPDLKRSGTVVAIAPTGTDIQGVTSYYASIVLNELDPRLKDGLTASAHVVTDKVDNVLVVPNAAIQRSGTTGVVTVMEADGVQRQVQVELGLAGDSTTQVLSGLREGQQVVLAQQDE